MEQTKLSKAEQELLDYVKAGWEPVAYPYQGIFGGPHYRIQYRGAGCGGETKEISPKVLHNLIERGLLEKNEKTSTSYSRTCYKLAKSRKKEEKRGLTKFEQWEKQQKLLEDKK